MQATISLRGLAGGVLALVVSLGAAPLAAQPAGSQWIAIESAFLDQFQQRHPSIAAGNALHAGDGGLEDFSPDAIAREVAELRRIKARIGQLPPAGLTPDQRVDARILDGIIDGWLLELTVVKTWQRNPMIYASAISDGVHNLMVMDHAPASQRLQLIRTKLERVPKLIASAQQNIPQPPRIFAQRAATFLRGAHDLITKEIWAWTR
jgi:hypothetical protein